MGNTLHYVTVSLGVFFAAGCGVGAVGRTNILDNPNQVRWKFSGEMATPHIAWGKPLAGGPVRATVIGPALAYRDVGELAQRLAMRVNPVFAESGQQVPATESFFCAYPDVGDTPDVWMGVVKERLKEAAEVLVIGQVQWGAFQVRVPAGGWEKGSKWDALAMDLRPELAKQIKAGCGLFYVGPALEKRTGGEASLHLPAGEGAGSDAVVRLKKVGAANELLRGLAGLKLPGGAQKEWTDCVYTGVLGEGRVLVLDCGEGGLHCLTPAWGGGPNLPCAYEYWMSLVARGVRWCAKREPEARLQKIEASANAGLRITVANRPEGAQLSAELRDAAGETGQVVKGWETAETNVPLPALKPGIYFANVWLKDRHGDTLDWGSARLEVAAGAVERKAILGIDTGGAAVMPGQAMVGDVLVAGWPKGDGLRLSVRDTFGRCLWREELKVAAGRVPFRVEVEPGQSTALRLRAERWRGAEAVESLESVACRWAELNGDFAAVLWAAFSQGNDRFQRQDLEVLRRLGIDTLFAVGPAMREECARANMRFVWHFDRITPHPGSAWSFCRPDILERWRKLYHDGAAEVKAFAPVALTFGDEAQYHFTSDGSCVASMLAPPYSDEDFRVFLGQWFDPVNGKLDLGELNKAWGTTFKAAEEIKVKPLAELRAINGRAQFVCEALWTEWQFHRLEALSTKAAQAHVPLAYFGDEGAGGMATGNGHDYYRLGREMSLSQLYDTEAGPFLIKSFAGPRSLRGMWTGNYGYYLGAVDEEWMRSRPWRSLFYGMNSEWWWMQSLAIGAEGRPIPCFAQYAEEIRRIKAGPATLLLKVAQPSRPQVGVLYSPNTIHVHTYDHRAPGPHPGALATVCEGLIRAGYAFKLLHPAQLADPAELSAGYRALVLPAILALSEQEAENIRRFVERGGLLIADQTPEQYFNELGVPYAKEPFRSVFAKGAEAAEYTYGKGKAIFLKEPFALSHLIRYHNILGRSWSEKEGKPLARLLRERIEGATAEKPPVTITLANGTALSDGEISTFRDGEALYVGVDRNGRYWNGELCRWVKWDDYQEEVAVTLTFPTSAQVYDVTRGEYLGQGPAVKTKLTSYPRLFAALPAKVEGVAVEGLAKEYRRGETVRCNVTVTHGAGGRCASVLHVSLRDARGELQAWSERNVMARAGQSLVELPLALDERAGDYRLEIRDVASSVGTTCNVAIRP